MPGRVARAPRAPAVSHKPLAQSVKSRASADQRNSSPVSDVPDEGPATSLRKHIGAIFADAQKSNTGHRKLVINLRKIQEAACYEPTSRKKGNQEDDFEEDDFNNEVMRCALRILPVKKSEPVGDRIVRFLGVFLRVASEKDNQLANPDPDATTLPETPTSRLATALFATLLPLLSAKDKVVRFRATQITAHMINVLDTLDDNLFHLLRLALLKRIHDKEPTVRMHAIYGLTRLAAELDGDQEADDSDDSYSGGSGVLEKLLDLLQNDPSAEVRRSLLLNLPFTPATLPYLLERARDLDAATRRALYARLLPALGDFRHLSLTHREKLLRWGLRDRDENVRKATARLFRERWIEDCAALPATGTSDDEGGPTKDPNQAADPSLDALLELLERIDVTNSGTTGGIALEAMRGFWDGRPDYRDYVTFDGAYWNELSPESVFVARTFNDYCRGAASETDGRLLDMLETKMPEVTKFGFLLEIQIKALVECVQNAASGGPDGDGDEEAEEESVGREFVVEQMLAMALTFDYSDEVGRRKMFSLMRESLALPELPEEATRLVVEVLRLVCGDDNAGKGEREFCGVVLEAVAEVHDTVMGDDIDKVQSDDAEDSFHSAKSEMSADQPAKKGKAGKAGKRPSEDEEMGNVDEEKAIREIMVNMKCLHIAQCLLQNVECDLEANVHLVTMLNNLVVPAVRSQEAPIRERGLVCLGLCCLLGKNLAQENLTLFLHCFAKGHPALQTIALQIIADIVTTHPALLAPTSSPADVDQTSLSTAFEPSPLLKPVLKAFSRALKSDDAAVQSTGATALSKLMLGQLITDTDLLKQLVITFFDPETSVNAQLRQALSYFLPVYCHSRQENAERMVQVAAGVISRLATLREAFVEDADADEAEMVTLSVVGGLLVDWTDPRKIVGAQEQDMARVRIEEGSVAIHASPHLMLAEQLLERLVTSQTSKDERKVLFSMLSKLHFAFAPGDAALLRTVLELVTEATDTKVATDATSRNTLTKMQTSLLKLVHDSATAERGGGGEETLLDETMMTATWQQTRTRSRDDNDNDDDEQEDEVTMQLRREMESTQIEDPEEEEGTVFADTTAGAGLDGFDVSQLPDEREMQSLMDSIAGDEDDDLLED